MATKSSEPEDVGCFGVFCSYIIRIVCCPFIALGCVTSCCCYYLPYHAIRKLKKRFCIRHNRWDVITQTFVRDDIENEREKKEEIEYNASILEDNTNLEEKIRDYYKKYHRKNDSCDKISNAHIHLDSANERIEVDLLRSMLFFDGIDDRRILLSIIGYPSLITIALLTNDLTTRRTTQVEIERQRVLILSMELLQLIGTNGENDVQQSVVEINTIYHRMILNSVGTLYQLFGKEMISMKQASSTKLFLNAEKKMFSTTIYSGKKEEVPAESIQELWRMITKDITITIRAVVWKVVNDCNSTTNFITRKNRGKAIQFLGKIYCEKTRTGITINNNSKQNDVDDEEAQKNKDDIIVSYLQHTANAIMFETIRESRLEET